MKESLVNTAIGRWLGAGRDRWGLLRAAWRRDESIGTRCNDQLATFLVTHLCQDGCTLVDVGAHIGSILAEARHANPKVRCIAIEAMPEKAAGLRKRFGDVIVHECAAGEQEGELPFFVYTKRSGYSSLGRPAQTEGEQIEEIRVPVKRLDDLVLSGGDPETSNGSVAQSKIDVIKIDVEGAELGVLRGATSVLSLQPTIMFESGPEEDHGLGYSWADLWRFLDEHDFAVLVPNRVAHNDPGLSLEGFCESHLYPRRATNYFAVARGRREEVRDRARKLLSVRVS